jgi:hypothetical protein
VLGNNLYIYGGYCLGSTKTDVWMFDTMKYKWKRLDDGEEPSVTLPFRTPATRCNQAAFPIVSSSLFFQSLNEGALGLKVIYCKDVQI